MKSETQNLEREAGKLKLKWRRVALNALEVLSLWAGEEIDFAKNLEMG